jgi:hypothetical protein
MVHARPIHCTLFRRHNNSGVQLRKAKQIGFVKLTEWKEDGDSNITKKAICMLHARSTHYTLFHCRNNIGN